MLIQENEHDYESYFCSELVAAAYQSMGLLSKELPASDYWPRSFESDKDSKGRKRLKFQLNAKLGEEQLIDFTLSIGF